MTIRGYKKILLALELNLSCDQHLLDRVMQIKQQDGVEIYLVHAVEHMSSYGAAYGFAAGVDVEEVLLEEARKQVSEIGQQYGIDASHHLIKVGPAKFIILEEAKRLNIDLILVGSHGRHGVRLLLGSTANAVLHGAECDVLAVRVREE